MRPKKKNGTKNGNLEQRVKELEQLSWTYPEVVGTDIIVEFLESEGAAVSARAFIWMRRYSEFNLDKKCFPPELFRGIIDARNRAASSTKNKEEAYAFTDNDVELLISDLEGKEFKLTRSRGDVYGD